MARISRYPQDNDLKGSDKLIGTDEDGLATKTFTLTSIFDELRQIPTPYVTMESPNGTNYTLSISDFGQVVVTLGVPNAPVFTSVPIITGDVEVADVLTVTAAVVSGLPTPFITLQWQRLPENSPWENIDGATGLNYSIVVTDLGARFRVRQTATNAVGTVSAESAQTAQVQGNPIQIIYIDPMVARTDYSEDTAYILAELTALDNIEIV
tara:strand:- start:117 stop:746 length:630 start_codon:yes stop_codon:yes gene_type:complete